MQCITRGIVGSRFGLEIPRGGGGCSQVGVGDSRACRVRLGVRYTAGRAPAVACQAGAVGVEVLCGRYASVPGSDGVRDWARIIPHTGSDDLHTHKDGGGGGGMSCLIDDNDVTTHKHHLSGDQQHAQFRQLPSVTNMLDNGFFDSHRLSPTRRMVIATLTSTRN